MQVWVEYERCSKKSEIVKQETGDTMRKLLENSRIAPLIFSGLLCLLLVLGFAINHEINKPKYIEGDYSSFTCEGYHCSNNPTWKLTSYGREYYYCDEHEDEGRERYNIYTSRKGSEERTMGRCWICGKEGSYQLDGSYYCHEHYNDRMFGRIG